MKLHQEPQIDYIERDELARLRAIEVSMGWRSIDTAPKDGTKILTFGQGHGNKIASHDANEKAFPMYAIAYWTWHDDTRDVEVSPGLFRKEPCRVLEGWRTEWSYQPTHWMRLPSNPTK